MDMKNWKVAFIIFYDNDGNILLNYRKDSWEEKDNLSFVKKFEITHNDRFYEVFFFQAKFPGFQAFSSSNEIKLSDLKFFSIDKALTMPLLPIAQKILQAM
ncbi:MAG: hypothetical protein US86_C0011G0005 [Candidatus Daviesbacteria bacterium GW2011_GWA2_38_24]|uniref:NUDIX hydrolase n=1 Tax=Candidatus Daviesbacteria bacterium GW2011_GWA2_38_24 TaxID=1618422 RepID=A0A0G0MKF1_9BACT|nr:MAG: hypothetical protein US86_C0011G0005 [Candidatus Daviesbacteria bacterium GW2011_GWA2_38_24]OGE22662.1 MAG: hypothetical protein A2688_03480 [Candidatus Daviesbacteria bacterium RIFCSPHIGHO2_01_FULL_38_8]